MIGTQVLDLERIAALKTDETRAHGKRDLAATPIKAI